MEDSVPRNDIGLTLVAMAPSDFDGCLCRTGDRRELRSASRDIVPVEQKAVLYYYVQSMPPDSLDGTTQHLEAFQCACDEWTHHTGVRFCRTNVRGEADFRVRRASDCEEEEANETTLTESFFYGSHPKQHIKVIKIWSRIAQWDAYSVYLHAIGHVLGMRHEDAYRSTTTVTRTGDGQTVVASQTTPLAKDESSVMCHEYLSKFNQSTSRGHAELSAGDKAWAVVMYRLGVRGGQ
jgi:hypothetical protein